MTNGIGNPDWQRRYTVSAVPLLDLTYADSLNEVSGVVDSNGYQYLLVTTNATSSGAFLHVKVDWFRDAAATQQMGDTDWTLAPNAFTVIKVPVITRYFKLEIGPVGGVTGNTLEALVYGTNSDQENMMTQNTSYPLLHAEPTIAGANTDTEQMGGIFGGPVNLFISDNANNLWTASVQYYDWRDQTWTTFWRVYGSAVGQTITQQIYLPYAPIRIQITNNDTNPHSFFESLVGP